MLKLFNSLFRLQVICFHTYPPPAIKKKRKNQENLFLLFSFMQKSLFLRLFLASGKWRWFCYKMMKIFFIFFLLSFKIFSRIFFLFNFFVFFFNILKATYVIPFHHIHTYGLYMIVWLTVSLMSLEDTQWQIMPEKVKETNHFRYLPYVNGLKCFFFSFYYA